MKDTKDMKDMEIYLKPTKVIDSDHPDVRGVALSLTKGLNTDPERAEKIFYFVRDKIRYNPYSPFHKEEFYVASTVLKRGDGYCIQKAVLLAALGRAVNIPTRLGFADIRNHQLPKKMLEIQGTDTIYSHGFTELFIEGRWLKATPAFNIEMCDKLGLAPVEFDGTSDGTFHRLDRKGNISIEYLKDVGNWPDLPLPHILESFVKLFGKERFELLMKVIDDMGHAEALKHFGVEGGEYP
ncbi:MAG: transglutaminase domain-containing protein [Deltaproteobacteria bacterium]|uniref:Transglutaminase domain-containing protein n=1 Tax=Candidatus Zymogenus saltonus TaxID=2844893 RepID=A0A9D8PQV6_9DELT|nr:transglutaminase domain-containing protein [Candidatus Zymogenus saltonus]